MSSVTLAKATENQAWQKDYVNEIGQGAGDIWKALVDENQAMTINELKKRTKLPEDLLYMGIGWLSREDKLRFSGTSKIEVAIK